MEKRNNTIYINLLGGFSITAGGNTVFEQGSHAQKPWILLEYLVTFRQRDIPSEELMDLFWNDENSSNPSGALKTLMFRVRKLLEPLGIPPQFLILQKRKAYGWNRNLDMAVDADRFEELFKESQKEKSDDEQLLAICMEAIDLYKGDFLPKSRWEAWTFPIRTYYRRLYEKLVNQALSILDKMRDYPAIIDICQRAIAMDSYEEDAHYYLIYALYQSGNQFMAMDHYQNVCRMFYNEFGITPSQRFKELYKLISDKKHGITMDLSVIRENLMEEDAGKGAFCCEPSVFRDVYQLETRAIERTGDSIFLCLFTVSSQSGELLKPAVQTRAMDELDGSIRSSLRRGDVYCRYSVSQYLLMLPTASYENAEMVLKRIVQNFKKAYSRKDLIISYCLQSITPN